MRHKHGIVGEMLCRLRPCRAARAAARAQHKARRAAATAALLEAINSERAQLYVLIDAGDYEDHEDPLLVNFARNGGTRHGKIKRVPLFGDPAPPPSNTARPTEAGPKPKRGPTAAGSGSPRTGGPR